MESIGKIGKLIISDNLKKQIDFLHKKIGNKEWSGILFYKTNTKEFKNLKKLEFYAHNMFLMDIGSHSYTEFEFGTDIVKAYDLIENAIESSIGMIHTHHTMNSFFSATDLEELKNNSKFYNYYVSLIVNFVDDYKCKIVFPSKTKVKYENTIKDINGKHITLNIEKEENILLEGDLDVVFESNVSIDNWFIERIKEVENKKLTFNETKTTYFNNFNNKEIKESIPKYVENNDDDIYEKNVENDKDLTKDFLLEILTFGSYRKINLKKAIQEIKCANELDFSLFIEMLKENIEIIHFNVYNTDDGYFDNIQKVINLLEKDKNNKNIKSLINFLTSEIYYERIYRQI